MPAEVLEIPDKQPLRPRQTPEDFQSAMAGLKERDVPYVYINRTKPPIKKEQVKQNPRPYNYIERIDFPLPSDLYGHIKRHHGGGEYQCLLNAKNRIPNCIGEAIIDVPITECDPILDVRELVRGNPLTEQLIRRWKKEGKVGETADGELFEITAGQAVPATVAAATPASPIVDRVLTKAVDRMFDEPKATSGAELIAAMREGREQAKELIQASGGGDSKLLDFALNRIASLEERNIALQEKWFEAMSKKPAESSNLDTAFQLFDKVSEKFGVGGQRSLVGEIGEAIGKFGPPLIGAIMMFRGGGMPPGLPAAAGSAPQPGATPAAPQPTAQDLAMQRNIDSVRKLGRRVIVAIDQDKDGADFAQSFVDMEGEEMYAAMVQAGVPTLIATLRTLPDLAIEFDKEPRPEKLNKFLQEFVTANDEEKEPVTA